MQTFGTARIFAIRSDIANAAPVPMGTMENIKVNFSAKEEELYGENEYPVDIGVGKKSIECSAKFAFFSGAILNNVFFGATIAPGQTLIALDEVATVPGTPYTFTVANGATFSQDLGVRYKTLQTPLAPVSSGPIIQQYSVSSSGVYSFAAGDTAQTMQVCYAYTATTGTTITGTNKPMGKSVEFMAIMSRVHKGKVITLKLFSCVSSKLDMSFANDKFMVPDLTWKAKDDGTGNVFQWSMSE